MQISNLIENILTEQPETRASDKRLILAVWDKLGLNLTYEQRQKFGEMPSTETIRRIRQKLNEQGKYLPPSNIVKERRFKSYRLQQISPSANSNYLEQTLEQRSLI